MAIKTVSIGSYGPYEFDDASTPHAVSTDGGIQADNVVFAGLSVSIRLTYSDANKRLQEVNDLTIWIKPSGLANDIKVTNNGDGTCTIGVPATLNLATALSVAGIKVVGAQQPAIADLTVAPTAADYNALLTVLRTHGLIAT